MDLTTIKQKLKTAGLAYIKAHPELKQQKQVNASVLNKDAKKKGLKPLITFKTK